MLVQDLRRDLVRAADEIRASRSTLGLELLAGRGRPPPFAADLGHHVQVRGVRVVRGAPGVVRDQTVRVDADRKLRRIVAGPARGLPVEVDERNEAPRLASDDRERQGKTEPSRAHDRLGMSADRDPDGKRIL